MDLRLILKIAVWVVIFMPLNSIGQKNIPAALRDVENIEPSLEKARQPAIDIYQRGVHRGASKSNTRLPIPKLKRSLRSSVYWEDVMFGIGAILAIFGLFAVILFHWIGAWAFLVALGMIGLGYVLMFIGAANSGHLDKIGIGLGMVAIIILDVFGFLLWGLIGLLIWLIP